MSYQQTRSTQDPPFYPNSRVLTLTGTSTEIPMVQMYGRPGLPPTSEIRTYSFVGAGGNVFRIDIPALAPNERLAGQITASIKVFGGAQNSIAYAFWALYTATLNGLIWQADNGGPPTTNTAQNYPGTTIVLDPDNPGGSFGFTITFGPAAAPGVVTATATVSINRSYL